MKPNHTVRGYCEECGKPCIGVWRDFGIGGYEFWGSRAVDENWQAVSSCCDGNITEKLPRSFFPIKYRTDEGEFIADFPDELPNVFQVLALNVED